MSDSINAGEILVNTTTAGDQSNPDIAVLENTNSVITWQGNGTTADNIDSVGIFAQIIDANGNKVGAEFLVNSYTHNDQKAAKITALKDSDHTTDDAGFVITWHSNYQDESSWGVYAQQYTADGVAVGDERLVNTYTSNEQSNPEIAALNDGKYVITWHSDDQNGYYHEYDVYYQMFNADGTKLGSETMVNSMSSAKYVHQMAPTISSASDGSFIITWSSGSQDGSNYGIYAQRFDSDGVKVGNETLINTTTYQDQSDSTIVTLADDTYVSVWFSDNQVDTDANTITLKHFSFNADHTLNVITDEVELHSPRSNANSGEFQDIVALTGGGYVVVWQVESPNDIWAQIFNADDTLHGDLIQIDNNIDTKVYTPTIAATDNGGFNVTWSSAEDYYTDISQDGDGHGIIVKYFDEDGDGFTNDKPSLINFIGDSSVYEDSHYSFDLSAYFSDSDADDTLTYSASLSNDGSLPTWLAVDSSTGILSGTPDNNDVGSFYVRVNVSDQSHAKASDIFKVTVINVNDAPLAKDDAYVVNEESTTSLSPLTNDIDIDGDAFNLFGTPVATNGTVVANANGTLTYTPNTGFTGIDVVTYQITDGDLSSNTATITIQVDAINHLPSLQNDSASVNEDQTIVIDVLANDTDADGDDLSIFSHWADNGDTTVTIQADGSSALLYSPNKDFIGTETISYQVVDSKGGLSSASITVTIVNVNDAPVAHNDITGIDTNLVSSVDIDVLANDTDVDGDSLSITGTPTALDGVVVVNANGTLNYTPNAGFNSQDTITYVITDGNGEQAIGKAYVLPNKAPTVTDDQAALYQTATLDIDVLANDVDDDGDSLSILGVPTATNGVVVVNADGTLNYTPNSGFSGSDIITYKVTDGKDGISTGRVDVTVTPNTPPVVTDSIASTNEDSAITIDALANASDTDTADVLSILGVPTASNGSVVVNADNTLTYTPNVNFNGQDVIAYTVSDDKGGSDSANITVTINPVHDEDIAVNDNVSLVDNACESTDQNVIFVVDVSGSMGGSRLANVKVAANKLIDTYQEMGQDIDFTLIPFESSSSVLAFNTGDFSGIKTAIDQLSAGGGTNYADASLKALSSIDEFTTNGNKTTMFFLSDGAPGQQAPVDFVAQAVAKDADIDLHAIGFDASILTYMEPLDNTEGAQSFIDISDLSTLLNVIAEGGTAVCFDEAHLLANDIKLTDASNLSVISGSVKVATGLGTLNVLGNGEYRYVPSTTELRGEVDTPILTYMVTDGINQASANIYLNLDSPVAKVDHVTLNEDVATEIDVLANDLMNNNDALSIVRTSQPTHGSVSIANGKVLYTPDANYYGVDSFAYTIKDSSELTSTAIVSINVVSVNDVPVANTDVAVANEDKTIIVDVLANDTDADGDALRIFGTPSADNGTVLVNGNGTISYTPSVNFTGNDTISYAITDDKGGVGSGEVVVTVTPNTAPVAHQDNVTTLEDQSLTLSPLTNDIDIDGDAFNLFGTPVATNGTVVANANGTLTYTPNTGFTGIDVVTYQITDGDLSSNTATITIQVDAINHLPSLQNDSASVNEDQTIVIDVLANDTDADGDDLSIFSHWADNGDTTVTIQADGSSALLYSPNKDFIGTETISYQVVDSKGGLSSASITVTIVNVNDAPVAHNDITGIDTNLVSSVDIDVLANDTDVDGDSLSITGTPTALDGVVVVNANGTLNYTPNAGFNSQDTITYVITDGNGEQAIGKAYVLPNKAPTVTDDQAALYQTATLDIDVLANDVDDDGDSLSILGVPTATNGVVVVNADGTLNYTPNSGFSGSDIITYKVTDGKDGISTGRVDVTVTPNTPPVVTDSIASTNEDSAITIDALANASDTDTADVLSILGVPTASNGSVVVNADNTLTYTPNVNFNGQDVIAYTVSDDKGGSDSANITVTINPVHDEDIAVNDNVSLVDNACESTDQNVIFVVDVSGSMGGSRLANVKVAANKLIDTYQEMGQDIDFTLIPFESSSSVLAFNTGDFSGIKTAIDQLSAGGGTNYADASLKALSSIDEFTTNGNKTTMFFLSDGAPGQQAPVDFVAQAVAKDADIDLHAIGFDASILTYMEPLDNTEGAQSFIDISDLSTLLNVIAEGGTAVCFDEAHLLANDIKLTDASNLSVISGSVKVATGLGTLNVLGNGEYRYVPSTTELRGEVDTPILTYMVTDGINQASANIYLNLDSPVAKVDHVTLNEDVATEIDVLANDLMNNNDALSIVRTSQPTHGSVSIANGKVLYTPDANYYGVDSFAYTIKDSSELTSTAIVSINVVSVNDVPVANTDVAVANEDKTIIVDVLANDTDADGDALRIFGTPSADNGTVLVNGNGTISYTPSVNFTGNDTISYAITDDKGGVGSGEVVVRNPIDALISAGGNNYLANTSIQYFINDENTGISTELNDGGVLIDQEVLFTHVELSDETYEFDKINISDAIDVLRHIVDLESFIPNSSSYHAADVNNDGEINISDAIDILRHIVDLESINTFDIIDEQGNKLNKLEMNNALNIPTYTIIPNGDVDLSGNFSESYLMTMEVL